MSRPATKPAPVGRKRASERPDNVSPKAPKPTQRERLVEAMISLAAHSGYQQVSIAQLSSRAGVSSATFYEQFKDKEACAVAAYQTATERVLGRFQLSDSGGWEDASRSAVLELMDAVRNEPDACRLLLVEARAAGDTLRNERERAVEQIETRIEARLSSSGGPTVDLPAATLAGAIRSLIVSHLRNHAEDELPLIVDDLMSWISCYAVPAGDARWRPAAALS